MKMNMKVYRRKFWDKYSPLVILFFFIFAIGTIMLLSGCGTISGFGQDLQNLSEGVKQGFTKN